MSNLLLHELLPDQIVVEYFSDRSGGVQAYESLASLDLGLRPSTFGRALLDSRLAFVLISLNAVELSGQF